MRHHKSNQEVLTKETAAMGNAAEQTTTWRNARSGSAASAASSSGGFGLRARSSNHRAQVAGRRQRAAAKTTGGLRKNYLRDKSVSTATRRNYVDAVEKFERRFDIRPDESQTLSWIDRRMCDYFNELYFEGYGHGVGRMILFGYIFLRCDDSVRHALPEARRTLAGWVKSAPGGVGLPIPMVAVELIAQRLVCLDLPRVAACILLQADLYARPSEMVDLLCAEVVPPNPMAGGTMSREWAVQFFASDLDRGVSKTGSSDDTVLIGACGRTWLRQVIAALLETAPGERLFAFTLVDYERYFAKAVRECDLESLQATPHALRHTGPSQDMLDRRTTLEAVQRRGRWSCFKSVARYEKHARLLKQTHRMTMVQYTAARAARKSLQEELVLKICADASETNAVPTRPPRKELCRAIEAAACRRRRGTK